MIFGSRKCVFPKCTFSGPQSSCSDMMNKCFILFYLSQFRGFKVWWPATASKSKARALCLSHSNHETQQPNYQTIVKCRVINLNLKNIFKFSNWGGGEAVFTFYFQFRIWLPIDTLFNNLIYSYTFLSKVTYWSF